ncbi:MAG: ABC transporter substrate-binding protein [Coleofasciculaceae cyanobacterium]
MTQKNETTVLVLALLVTATLLGAGFWWFTNRSGVKVESIVPQKNPSGNSPEQISLGDKILIAADSNPSKKAGVEAFAKKDFQSAKTQFEASLKQNRNDPETLIYLNNASVANSNPVKIAVSVPIGGNLNVAKEMLRGVAQAQTEAIRDNKLNLQVEIANDNNNPDRAKQIARELVNDQSILAVVGHNSSDATLAAAPEYQKGKLVVISPTSDAQALPEIGNYVFRTILSISNQAEVLANYAVKNAGKTNTVICTDSQAKASESLKEEFTKAVATNGGKIAAVNCDLSAATFNANTVISQAISQGADSLLLLPSVDRLTQGLDVAQANQRRLALFGSSTMYTIQTLQQGQAAVNGMIMAVAWAPKAIPGNPFAENAVKLWGGEVNWRSATAYDATEAIIAGLQQNKTREGLQQALSNTSFSANGATGEVQFSPSGDRKGTSILLQVQPNQVAKTGFDFVPLKP